MKGFIMDFERKHDLSGPVGPEPVASPGQGGPAVETQRKGVGWKIVLGVILVLSILANIALFLILLGVVTVFAAGQRKGFFVEEVIKEGPRSTKIAIINLEGIIYDEQAENIRRQLDVAQRDRRVKGVIIRVNSPGGTISGSDQIYNEIRKYRQEQDKPVVAFMQGVAASGGYYTSVACEKIIAEPTTITGSIGVMFGHFVLQELLEKKLGIQPVIITSSPKKDWPSSFEPITDEQRQYIQEKLIGPAYNRFVEIVAAGRPMLSLDEVRRLADGSIYGAQEAVGVKLIDEIGYLDEAIELVKAMAGIEKARVVEYRRPFSLVSFLSYYNRNILKIDRDTLYEFTTPQVLYLWSIY